jgi:hypothetical protein
MRRPTGILLAALALAAAVPVIAGAQKKPPKPPATDLSLAASPNPVTYGRSTVLSGQLRGKDHGGRRLGLEEKAHPYQTTTLTRFTTTDSRGRYSFRVVPRKNTRYRVVTASPTPYEQRQTSPELLVRVRIRVGIRLSDSTPGRGRLVRFFGSALPEHDGRPVSVQRRTRTGRWRTVRRTVLKDAGTRRSQYSRRVRVFRDGVFRVRVRGHGDHASGTSRRRAIDVH